jgi:hypothetical protein
MGGKQSSQTTTNSYDPVASQKMAEIADRQQAMAEDQWSMYKTYFQDYEISVANANKDLLPYMSDSTKEQLKYQGEASKANTELLPAATALNKTELEGAQPVAEKFYKDALTGVDPNKRADEASNEVKAGAKLGESMRRREASRYGIDPGSSTYANVAAKGALDTSRNIAGARIQAKDAAETENFNRLGLALGKTTSPVVGSGAVTTVNNADPAARATQSFSGAASSYAPLATRVLSSTKTTDNGGSGFGSFLGTLGGTALGAYTGSYFTGLGAKAAK